jgi:hypothetical protein
MITAISCVPSSAQAFLSAGRNGEVLVWQITMQTPAATLLPPKILDGGGDENASVITCLEVLGHLVLAGTYGQGTNVWNLRYPSPIGILTYFLNMRNARGEVFWVCSILSPSQVVFVPSVLSGSPPF